MMSLNAVTFDACAASFARTPRIMRSGADPEKIGIFDAADALATSPIVLLLFVTAEHNSTRWYARERNIFLFFFFPLTKNIFSSGTNRNTWGVQRRVRKMKMKEKKPTTKTKTQKKNP